MTIGLYKYYHLVHNIFLSISMVTDTGLILYILKYPTHLFKIENMCIICLK